MSDHTPPHPNRYVAAIMSVIAERELSLYAFARLTDVSEGTIRSWVKRGTGPSTATLERICAALDLSVEDLLGKSDSITSPNCHKLRITAQLGDDGVQNSQLIVRSIRNLHADFRKTAQLITKMSDSLADLAEAIETVETMEQKAEKAAKDAATSTAANGTTGR